LHESYESFQEAGAEVVALAVAPLSSVTSGVLEVLKVTYPLLADPNHEVAEAFNVYDVFGDGYAAPSVFVIDTDGSIVWGQVAKSPRDRPNPGAILEQLP